MEALGYYNGAYGPLDEMTVPMTDRAVYYGDGVYEATPTRNKVIYALDAHVNRMLRSASLLRIDMPMDTEACPWNENAALLMVGVGAQKIATDDLPRSNIVFLVDTSGSMDGPDRLDLIKRAFALFTENLREGDVISIVTYAGTDRVELEGVDGARRSEIMDKVNAMEAMPAMGMYSNKGFSFSFNTEEYSQIVESGFKSVLTSPLSTFAADVDTAGYTTVRRKLLNGEMPGAQRR